jgi:uncharacterized membrane protein YkvA (DUF1232 family)
MRAYQRFLTRWKKRAAFFKREVFSLYYAYRSPAVPWYARGFAALVVAYAFSPIDLIPDFIPILGYVDDLILIPAGVTLAIRLIPAEVMQAARQRVDADAEAGGHANWWVAALIIAIWVLIATLLVFRLYAALT